MYPQVEVCEPDRKFQKFLSRDEETGEIHENQHNRLTFGVKSATYLAVKSLQQLAEEEKKDFPRAAEVVKRDFYVDDGMSGADTEQMCVKLCKDLRELLGRGKFELSKFISNSEKVLESIPEKDGEIKLPMEIEMDNTVKTLGVEYHPTLDEFRFRVKLKNKTGWPTKRSLLSETSSLYDPLGWLAPVVVRAKILFQKLWEAGHIAEAWIKIRDELHLMEELRIHRWIGKGCVVTIFEIHGFSDASEDAYSAVVYSRIVNEDGSIHITLLAAKTRVAPLKRETLPRLELCGLVLLANLMSDVRKALPVVDKDMHAWTDSMIVLGWLNTNPAKLKTYVANRVVEANNFLNGNQCHHIEGTKNPADCASRGINPSELERHPLWWNGPDCLRESSVSWEQDLSIPPATLELKVKKIATNLNVLEGDLERLLKKHSDIHRVVRIVAISLKFLDGLKRNGFEIVESLTLHGNNIGQLNENVFRSLTKLSNLDLSRNDIFTVDKNAFEDLTELRTLKLSSNKLKLREGIFDCQKYLNLLCLRHNSLKHLTKEMFRGLDSLRILSIENNKFTRLMDNVFHNLQSLTQISLGNSNMRIPSTLFAKQSHLEFVNLDKVKVHEGLQLSGLRKLQIKSSEVVTISGLTNIETVSIIQGKLHQSALTSFKDLRSTKELNLSSNNISNLVDGIFDGLKELVRLQLSKNHLTNISGLVFRDLQNLNEIDLSHNNLTTIHPDAFINTDQLTNINLYNNKLSFSDNKMPFTHLYHLETLNLSKNELKRMPADLDKLEKLKEMDLSFNQITSVKFVEIRQNVIRLSPTYETRSALRSKVTRTNLNNNPLDCDCSMFKFLSGTNQQQLAPVFSNECLKDDHQMEACTLKAYVSDQCPSECSCTKLEDRSGVQIAVSCKGKQFTRLPEIKFMNATSIVLDISNNSLTELPVLPTSFNVTFIQASFNQISEIKSKNLPSNLRGLDLSHNNVQTIAAHVIDDLKKHQNLEILLLKDNLLACHCSDDTVQLINFITENSSITDMQQAKCNGHYDLSHEGLRKKCEKEALMYTLIFVTILTLLSAVILVLVIRHHKFIKMWLYAHDWFLWWVDEEYVDRHKVYDIFISYTNENRMLAYRITYALEKCNIFKVCLHERDFVGGERIEKSVRDAVNKSRRTLVILTENYVQSEWCEHEFHLAWERSVAENRKLIIAVKAGNLGHIADETIDSYIKTHTYIEVDDQWFWERLIFRLPHKKMIKNIFPIREYDVKSEIEDVSVYDAKYANEGQSVKVICKVTVNALVLE